MKAGFTVQEFAEKWLEAAAEARVKQKAADDAAALSDNVLIQLQGCAWALGAFQVLLLILFGTVGGQEDYTATTSNGVIVLSPSNWVGTPTQGYNMFIGVLIMMLVGFSALMTFIKWYGVGSMGFVLLVTAMGIQWSLFTESFFAQAIDLGGNGWHNVYINIYSLLNTLYAISAVLITFGAVIGKITPLQLIILTFIELILHSINYQVLMVKVMELTDMGGTYIDHMFGAYFGLAVAWMLGKPMSEPEFGNVHDILSLFGTVFLWIYWPSFVVGAAPADSTQQARGFANTIIALSASTVAAFWGTLFFSKKHKFRPVDIQNATLAGGVAIGCTANLYISAFDACFIGVASGIVSVIGYNFIQPWLETNWNLHDTCGVHNLHAMPSVIGALASVIIAGYKGDNQNGKNDDLYYNVPSIQWWRQLVAILLCIGFAVSTGLITGWILNKVNKTERNVPDKDSTTTTDHPDFHDNVFWEVAGDYNRSLYTELGMLLDGVSDMRSGTLVKVISDFSSHSGRRDVKLPSQQIQMKNMSAAALATDDDSTV